MNVRRLRRHRTRFPLLLLILASLAAGLWTAAAHGQASYKVGAYYFGVWSADSCVSCGPGNSDWWKGPREYYNGNPDPAFQGEDFSYLKPALGFYDSSQVATLEKQIRQARANGLQFFNFYWYWGSQLNGGQGGEIYGGGLNTFLAAKNTEDLEFAISITSHPWGNLNITAAQAPAAIDLLIQKYLTKSHYLRSSDGRPVVFLLDTRGIKNGGHSDAQDFVALLTQKVQQQMNVTPFVVLNAELHNLDASSPHYIDVRTVAGTHGYSCLNYFGISLNGSATVGDFIAYNNRIRNQLGAFPGKPMIPCYMIDFDEKPRTKTAVPAAQVRHVLNWSVSELVSGLTEVRNFVNSPSQYPVDNWVNLYAWNEWDEGGVNLEPSHHFGFRQLEKVSSVFGLATSGTDSCKKLGNCTQNLAAPHGTLDVASCSTIAGWARDPDTATPTWVDLYKGGPYGQGGTFVGRYPASLHRSDLPFRDRRHGFSIPTPAAFKTGAPVKVYAYGLNINWNGSLGGTNLLLNGVPKTVTCAP